MIINGSAQFKANVEEAIRLWRSVDRSKAQTMLNSITSINEHTDAFKVRTYEDGKVYIARNASHWPGTDEILQQRILATYIAHEGVHAWSLAQKSPKWNSPEVEQIALEYQSEIASRLGISDQYVNQPLHTLGTSLVKTESEYVNPDPGIEIELPRPLVALLGAAFIAVVLNRATRNKRKVLVRLFNA